jgi:hypothetical protein
MIFNEAAFVIIGGIVGTLVATFIVTQVSELNLSVVIAGLVSGFIAGTIGGIVFSNGSIIDEPESHYTIEYEEQAFVDDFEL